MKNTKLRNNLKKIVKNKGILDIILFGSLVRGKVKPNDVDVVIIFKNKADKNLEYKIKGELENYFNNLSLISKTMNGLLHPSFDARDSIFFEGISLLFNDKISERYGLSSLGMFKYSFKNWSQLEKTKFYYALNGRGGKKGVLRILNCIKISDNLILAPLEKIEEMKEFLESWEISYAYIPILLPERLNKRTILLQ